MHPHQSGRRSFVTGMLAAGGCASLAACVRGETSATAHPAHAHARAEEAGHGAGTGADLEGGPGDETSADPFAALAGFCDGVPAIAQAEFEARIEALRARMVAAQIGGLVVESGAAMQYLGGPRWRRSERPLLLAVGRGGEVVLVGSAFERHTYEGAGVELPLGIRVWEEDEDPF
ncbi:MAG: aminopeptidase P family N-terminal domain-containing protein, partial [Myxococcales bacterium]|nr:aminopeptidase P family N-terminal domain-containing protein [Myxococcales bacterium]